MTAPRIDYAIGNPVLERHAEPWLDEFDAMAWPFGWESTFRWTPESTLASVALTLMVVT